MASLDGDAFMFGACFSVPISYVHR